MEIRSACCMCIVGIAVAGVGVHAQNLNNTRSADAQNDVNLFDEDCVARWPTEMRAALDVAQLRGRSLQQYAMWEQTHEVVGAMYNSIKGMWSDLSMIMLFAVEGLMLQLQKDLTEQALAQMGVFMHANPGRIGDLTGKYLPDIHTLMKQCGMKADATATDQAKKRVKNKTPVLQSKTEKKTAGETVKKNIKNDPKKIKKFAAWLKDGNSQGFTGQDTAEELEDLRKKSAQHHRLLLQEFEKSRNASVDLGAVVEWSRCGIILVAMTLGAVIVSLVNRTWQRVSMTDSNEDVSLLPCRQDHASLVPDDQ